ncbi:MAG TPA: hypothetical protein VFB19_02830 [Mycobacterium sp.]|nr:hypothetical protein [Mycobacterium sp.]
MATTTFRRPTHRRRVDISNHLVLAIIIAAWLFVLLSGFLVSSLV